MKPNPVKRALKAGQPLVGTWLSHNATVLTDAERFKYERGDEKTSYSECDRSPRRLKKT